MLSTTESPCHSKTLEMSTPKRGATLECKPQQDYGKPMSQYYNSVLRSTTPALQSTATYDSGTTT